MNRIDRMKNQNFLHKELSETLLSEHQAQVINYLRACEVDVGLLINFGAPKL
jgi:GxxExxY protein